MQRSHLLARDGVGQIDVAGGKSAHDQPLARRAQRQVMGLGEAVPQGLPGKHGDCARSLQRDINGCRKVGIVALRAGMGGLRQAARGKSQSERQRKQHPKPGYRAHGGPPARLHGFVHPDYTDDRRIGMVRERGIAPGYQQRRTACTRSGCRNGSESVHRGRIRRWWWHRRQAAPGQRRRCAGTGAARRKTAARG